MVHFLTFSMTGKNKNVAIKNASVFFLQLEGREGIEKSILGGNHEQLVG